MLSEITNVKEVKKLDFFSINEVINMDIEVFSDDEFVRGGSCLGKKRSDLVMKDRQRVRIR